MSEQAEVIEVEKLESKAAPEIQERAVRMGWKGPDKFKGDPARFVDADEFVERGEAILPVVRKELEQTQSELASVKAREAQTQASLAAAQKAIEEINLRHSVATQKAVEKAREDLKVQLAAASEAGDHIGVAEITDQLTKTVAVADASAAVAKTVEETPKAWEPSPAMKAWNTDNAWYGTDKEKTDMANAAARLLRISGDTSMGAEFLDKAKAEMEAAYELKHPKQEAVDKVAGGRNGDASEVRQGGRKTYNNLPADAKRQCDADARNFVGPGKLYKTAAEWNSAFTQLYFEAE